MSTISLIFSSSFRTNSAMVAGSGSAKLASGETHTHNTRTHTVTRTCDWGQRGDLGAHTHAGTPTFPARAHPHPSPLNQPLHSQHFGAEAYHTAPCSAHACAQQDMHSSPPCTPQPAAAQTALWQRKGSRSTVHVVCSAVQEQTGDAAHAPESVRELPGAARARVVPRQHAHLLDLKRQHLHHGLQPRHALDLHVLGAWWGGGGRGHRNNEAEREAQVRSEGGRRHPREHTLRSDMWATRAHPTETRVGGGTGRMELIRFCVVEVMGEPAVVVGASSVCGAGDTRTNPYEAPCTRRALLHTTGGTEPWVRTHPHTHRRCDSTARHTWRAFMHPKDRRERARARAHTHKCLPVRCSNATTREGGRGAPLHACPPRTREVHGQGDDLR
jgi:hypothetical protein